MIRQHYDECSPALKAAIRHFRPILKTSYIPEGWHSRLFVAGGALPRFFEGNKEGDIDVFCLTGDEEIQVQMPVAGWAQWSTVRGPNSLKQRFHPEYLNVDYITNEYESIEACLHSFDLTVCQCAVNTDSIVYSPNFFRDVATRQLIFDNLPEDPILALNRLQKYIRRGYTLPEEENIRLLEQASLVDFDELYVKREKAKEKAKEAVDAQPIEFAPLYYSSTNPFLARSQP